MSKVDFDEWGWPEHDVMHHTPKGVLRVRFGRHASSHVYAVFFDRLFLGLALSPDGAARDFADGKFDADLGFPASTLKVPPSVSDWNRGRW